MSHKPELPVEVVTQIEKEAEAYSETRADHLHNIIEYNTFNDINGGYIAGATAYATKLIECDKANSAIEEKVRGLEEENAELRRQNEKLKAQAEGWRPMLEDILNHDYISEDLIQKITKFLYGE